MTSLSLVTSLHILAAAVFVGSNVLMARLTKRLEAIPPREAARLSGLIGGDVAIINGTALLVLGGAGFYRVDANGMWSQLFTWEFFSSGYGATLWLMIFLWLCVIFSSTFMIFWFRPRLTVKLPYNASREVVEAAGNAIQGNAAWISRLAWVNLACGVLTVLESGFLKYGGFWQ